MDLKQWFALILVSSLKLAIRAGLTSLLIPMSAAADVGDVMANQRANAFFEVEKNPVVRTPASLGNSATVTPKKKKAMTTADVTKGSAYDDTSFGGVTRPLVNTAPAGFPAWVGATPPPPGFVPPQAPAQSSAPPIPPLPSAPSAQSSAPAQSNPPAAPSAPAQSSAEQPAPAQPSTPPVAAQGLDLPNNYPIIDNTKLGKSIVPANSGNTNPAGNTAGPGTEAVKGVKKCADGTCNDDLPSQGKKIAAMAKQEGDSAATGSSKGEKLAEASVYAATRTRQRARFCGGGVGIGNVSKCMCASGVKEALLSAGVCGSRPSGNAVDMKYSLKSCSGLHNDGVRRGTNPANAPFNSVIVYSTTRHSYGHVETKIQVTAENIKKFERQLGDRLKVGQALYCSDFCRAYPTLSRGTNTVEAIFSM